MPTIKLELISTIKKLRNKEFMQLYLQIMELTEQYVITTKDEFIQRIYENMQKEVKRVKLLESGAECPIRNSAKEERSTTGYKKINSIHKGYVAKLSVITLKRL